MSSGQPISAKEYAALLEKLLAEGAGYARTGEIVTFPAPGGQNFYITHDIQKGLDLVMRGLQPNANDPAFSLREKSVIQNSYEPADPSNPSGRWKLSAATHRLVLLTTETTVIPWQFGEAFAIANRGYLMVQQKDIEALSQALVDIRAGKTTEDDALYTVSATGEKIAKFDVYPYDQPDLDAGGLFPVEMNDKTKAISAHFRKAAADDAAFAALPFTRKSANFVSDHVAPERASFRKRAKSLTLAGAL